MNETIWNCVEARARLEEFVDGLTSSAVDGRLRGHLDGCAACRDEEAELRRLREALADLPREMAPERDLWTGIAPRLRARPLPAVRPAVRRTAWRSRIRQLAAAFGFMALGALLAQLAISPRPATTAGRDDGSRATVVPAGEARPASADFRMVEADYLEAKEQLWLAVYRSRDRLSPETVGLVEDNLRVIDEAIRELRTALDNDPGNPRLQNLLLASHRKEIGLLQRLAS